MLGWWQQQYATRWASTACLPAAVTADALLGVPSGLRTPSGVCVTTASRGPAQKHGGSVGVVCGHSHPVSEKCCLRMLWRCVLLLLLSCAAGVAVGSRAVHQASSDRIPTGLRCSTCGEPTHRGTWGERGGGEKEGGSRDVVSSMCGAGGGALMCSSEVHMALYTA